jgi:hypothetical protein
MKPLFAEDMNYFDMTVHPAKSLGEIQELLEDFGAPNVMVTQGQSGGKHAWLIRFMWQDKPYRFMFSPLPCRQPQIERSFGGKRRTNEEQSRWQMGRIAVHFVKAILTAAGAHPHALFGFMELAAAGEPGRLPPTVAELNVDTLIKALPDLDVSSMPLLEA